MKNIRLANSSKKERLAAEREASLLSQLQHPNIVSYKESFQDSEGCLHIVMGYCEGGDLCTRLKAQNGVRILCLCVVCMGNFVSVHKTTTCLLFLVCDVKSFLCSPENCCHVALEYTVLPCHW